MKLAIKRGRVSSARTNGRLCCGSPRSVALGIFGALTKLKSAANDLPYTSQVAPGLFGQSNAQASKVAHWLAYRVCHSEYGAVLFDDDRFLYYIHVCTALFSTIEQTQCAFVACDSERLSLFVARFELSPKWCTYSVVLGLHGWCLVKLLSSLRILCTLYNYAPCHVTFMQSHVRSVYACLVVTFRLHLLAE